MSVCAYVRCGIVYRCSAKCNRFENDVGYERHAENILIMKRTKGNNIKKKFYKLKNSNINYNNNIQ